MIHLIYLIRYPQARQSTQWYRGTYSNTKQKRNKIHEAEPRKNSTKLFDHK